MTACQKQQQTNQSTSVTTQKEGDKRSRGGRKGMGRSRGVDTYSSVKGDEGPFFASSGDDGGVGKHRKMDP